MLWCCSSLSNDSWTGDTNETGMLERVAGSCGVGLLISFASLSAMSRRTAPVQVYGWLPHASRRPSLSLWTAKAVSVGRCGMQRAVTQRDEPPNSPCTDVRLAATRESASKPFSLTAKAVSVGRCGMQHAVTQRDEPPSDRPQLHSWLPHASRRRIPQASEGGSQLQAECLVRAALVDFVCTTRTCAHVLVVRSRTSRHVPVR